MKKSELVEWLMDVLELNVKASVSGAFISAAIAVIVLMTSAESGIIVFGCITLAVLFGVSCIASGFAYDYLNKRLRKIKQQEEKNAKKRK